MNAFHKVALALGSAALACFLISAMLQGPGPGAVCAAAALAGIIFGRLTA